MTKATHASSGERNTAAATLAPSTAGARLSETTSVIQYSSRGRVAVIGGIEAQEFASRLSGQLTAQVILTEGAVEPGVPAVPVGNRQLGIEGYLGNFSIVLGDEGRPNFETVSVDMILDLSANPILTMPVKPPGYLTAVAEEPCLTEVEHALKALTGTFEKPKYFDYDPSICAHGRSGIAGCTACIDACPADAITSLVESVAVNPNLCQGGGICASACPTGAIRYVYPSATDTLRLLRTLLSDYYEAGGREPVIAFVAVEESGILNDVPANILVVVVEELASTGLEIWLSALAYGAKRVLLVDTDNMPTRVAEYLQLQLETTGRILQGMGYSDHAVRLVDHRSLHLQSDTDKAFELAVFAQYAGSPEKRRTALQAIDHLYHHSDADQAVIGLPAQSPFGRILVDGSACTLCMSCTSVCPSNAINAGNDSPKLEFHEINCVQCGICARACPEQAITLEPRLIADPEMRRRAVTLHEETPFCCIRCGQAFATRTLINNMKNKLAGHHMFQSERAQQRLMMCEKCRLEDVVQDADAMHPV